MDAIEQAFALINMDPVPDDAVQQMKEIEALANEFEALHFPEIWEGLFIKMAERDNARV